MSVPPSVTYKLYVAALRHEQRLLLQCTGIGCGMLGPPSACLHQRIVVSTHASEHEAAIWDQICTRV